MIIDLDADPFVRAGMTVVEHKKGGRLDLAKSKVVLVSGEARKSTIGEGYELLIDLHAPLILNANALDFFFANPGFIPEGWKGKCVSFWGTIYRARFTGNEYVRYLDCRNDRRRWDFHRLGPCSDSSIACAQTNPSAFDADEIVC